MPPQRNVTTSYLPHKQSGRARVVWYDVTGMRRQKLLPGPFGSAESLAAKAQFDLELATSPACAAAALSALTVAEFLLAYLTHAEQHYRGVDGEPTDEVRHLKATMRPVRELYGASPMSAFGPLALKAVRQRYVDLGWSRKTVNARVERVRRIVKWGVAEELVPAAVYQALAAVPGLERGRPPARESEAVGPVDDTIVDATLPYLTRHVRGLVEFQRLTGCRPSEACVLRRRDIDTGGPVWLYRPPLHKTAYRGRARIIAIGPKAQALLDQFPTDCDTHYVFSPAHSVAEAIAARAANRKTPCYPSHTKRNAAKRVGAKRKRPPAGRYTRVSYLTAVTRACDRAFPPVGELARLAGEPVPKWRARLTDEQRAAVKEWQRRHHWHPNQLRHAFATRVRKAHGLEAAQVLLGHARVEEDGRELAGQLRPGAAKRQPVGAFENLHVLVPEVQARLTAVVDHAGDVTLERPVVLVLERPELLGRIDPQLDPLALGDEPLVDEQLLAAPDVERGGRRGERDEEQRGGEHVVVSGVQEDGQSLLSPFRGGASAATRSNTRCEGYPPSSSHPAERGIILPWSQPRLLLE